MYCVLYCMYAKSYGSKCENAFIQCHVLKLLLIKLQPLNFLSNQVTKCQPNTTVHIRSLVNPFNFLLQVIFLHLIRFQMDIIIMSQQNLIITCLLLPLWITCMQCGVPVEMRRCSECGAKIGGNYHLRSDNTKVDK